MKLIVKMNDGTKQDWEIGQNKVRVEFNALLFKDSYGNMHGLIGWQHYTIVVGERRAGS